MKNYIGPGNTIPWTNDGAVDVASGDGVIVGALFGVAQGDIAVGQSGELALTGVWELPKPADEDWTFGQHIYWADGQATATEGDDFIGVAVAGSDGPAGEIRLSAANIGAGGGGGGYVGPLDIAGGASFAYSSRALSAAKRDTPIYTVKESGGNTTQTFSSDAVTGDAPVDLISAFIGGGAGGVTVWKDQSANGRDVTSPETTAEPAPVWSADIDASGRPGLVFTSDFIAVGSALETAGSITIASGAYTAFIVAKSTFVDPSFQVNSAGTACGIEYSATNKMELDIGSNADGLRGRFDIYDADADGETGGPLIGPAFSDHLHVVEVAMQFGQRHAMVDGVAVTLGTDYDYNGGPASISGALQVGGANAGAAGALNCPLLELIFYPSYLSDSDLAAVRANIATYYGITLP